jgi:exonuclease SbcD
VTRLMHLADLHLGLVTHSRPDPKTGLPSALLSGAHCWNAAVQTALDAEVDAVIVAGDIFHDRNPSAAAMVIFAQGLQKLTRANVDVLIVVGNHDRAPHPGQHSVLESFDSPSSRIVVSTDPGIIALGSLKVATLPSVSRHQLMATYPMYLRGEADQQLMDGLCRILAAFRAENPDILTGHWPVQGAVLGNEKDIAIVPEPVIPLAELDGPWQYMALGHIHGRQTLLPGRYPIGHYSGSIDRVNFGEEDDWKGGVLVELGPEGGQISTTFFDTPARRFLTLSLADYTRELADLEGAIVRIKDRVTEEQAGQIDKTAIARDLEALGAESVVFAIDVERKDRRRAEAVTESLTPLVALDEYFANREVPEDRRTDLRELAAGLLQEVGP